MLLIFIVDCTALLLLLLLYSLVLSQLSLVTGFDVHQCGEGVGADHSQVPALVAHLPEQWSSRAPLQTRRRSQLMKIILQSEPHLATSSRHTPDPRNSHRVTSD